MRTRRETDELIEQYGLPVFYDSEEMYAMDDQRLDRMEKDIKDIKDNHLNSIYKALSKLRGQVWYILGILVVGVPAVLLILAKVW